MREEERKFLSVSKKIPSVKNYKRGYLQPDGTRIYFGHWNTENALFVLSGATLHNMRINGVEIEDYLENILTKSARVSRLDICLTQFIGSHLYVPSDYVKLINKKKIISSHAKHGAKYIASVDEDYRDNIETVYIGDMKNRAKNGIVRVYDKGLELDIGKYLMTRVENEEKRDKAHVSCKRIASGKTIPEVLKSRLDFEDDKWQELINCDYIDMSRGKQISPTLDIDMKYAKKWAWLINTVAPVIADAIDNDVSQENYRDHLSVFNKAIETAYEKIQQKKIQQQTNDERESEDYMKKKLFENEKLDKKMELP